MLLELHISLIDLVLINFEFLRIQWTTIKINNSDGVSNTNIDCNHTLIHKGNFFLNYTCTMDKNAPLYIIDLSTTKETLTGLVLNDMSIVQRY